MRLFGGGSLRLRLTGRLVVLQALAISLVTVAGLYALMLRYGIDGHVIDLR